MVSSRLAQLLEQRRASSTQLRFGGGTRVLTGGNSLQERSNAIALKTTTSELELKTKQYNDGLISNEEMRGFLVGLQNNTLLSQIERYDVSSKIRDFDSRIRLGKLEAVYKNAPDNSLVKVSAATAISNFYAEKAGAITVDTPAYSQAIESSGQWKQSALKEQDQVEKLNRSLRRAQLFKEVASTAPNSIEEARQKALAYQELAKQARSDGDETQALQLETRAQNEVSSIPAITDRNEKQALVENRRKLNDYINTTLNDYKDGRISAGQVKLNLEEADKYASELGDTSSQIRLNTISSSIDRDIEKGVSYQNEGAFGSKIKGGGSGELSLDVGGNLTEGYSGGTGSVSGGGGVSGNVSSGGGTGGPAPSATSGTLSSIDRNYEEQIKKAHKWFLDGQTPDGKRYGSNEYVSTLYLLADDRKNDLTNVVSQLSNMNPDAKVGYRGSKIGVEKLKNQYEEELNNVVLDVNKFRQGDVLPIMEVDGKGKPKLSLKSASEIQGLQDNYMIDSQGVAHKIKQDRQYFDNQDAIDQYLSQNPTAKTKTDIATGKSYIGGPKYVDVYDTAGNKIRYQEDPQYGLLPVVTGDPKTDAVAKSLETLRNVIIKEADTAAASGKAAIKRTYTPEQLQTFIESKQADKILNPRESIQLVSPDVAAKGGYGAAQLDVRGTSLQGSTKPGLQGLNKLNTLGDIKPPIVGADETGMVKPTVIAPVQPGEVSQPSQAPSVNLQIPSGTDVRPNQQSVAPSPLPVQSKQYVSAPVQPTQPKLQLPQKSPLQSSGIKLNLGPQYAPPPVQQPSMFDSLKNTVSNLAQKILPNIFKKK